MLTTVASVRSAFRCTTIAVSDRAPALRAAAERPLFAFAGAGVQTEDEEVQDALLDGLLRRGRREGDAATWSARAGRSSPRASVDVDAAYVAVEVPVRPAGRSPPSTRTQPVAIATTFTARARNRFFSLTQGNVSPN